MAACSFCCICDSASSFFETACFTCPLPRKKERKKERKWTSCFLVSISSDQTSAFIIDFYSWMAVLNRVISNWTELMDANKWLTMQSFIHYQQLEIVCNMSRKKERKTDRQRERVRTFNEVEPFRECRSTSSRDTWSGGPFPCSSGSSASAAPTCTWQTLPESASSPPPAAQSRSPSLWGGPDPAAGNKRNEFSVANPTASTPIKQEVICASNPSSNLIGHGAAAGIRLNDTLLCPSVETERSTRREWKWFDERRLEMNQFISMQRVGRWRDFYGWNFLRCASRSARCCTAPASSSAGRSPWRAGTGWAWERRALRRAPSATAAPPSVVPKRKQFKNEIQCRNDCKAMKESINQTQGWIRWIVRNGPHHLVAQFRLGLVETGDLSGVFLADALHLLLRQRFPLVLSIDSNQ